MGGEEDEDHEWVNPPEIHHGLRVQGYEDGVSHASSVRRVFGSTGVYESHHRRLFPIILMPGNSRESSGH